MENCKMTITPLIMVSFSKFNLLVKLDNKSYKRLWTKTQNWRTLRLFQINSLVIVPGLILNKILDRSSFVFFFLANGQKTYHSSDEKQRINLEQPNHV